VVIIYKRAFTVWHHPGIVPGTFRSQIGDANHYSTAAPLTLEFQRKQHWIVFELAVLTDPDKPLPCSQYFVLFYDLRVIFATAYSTDLATHAKYVALLPTVWCCCLATNAGIIRRQRVITGSSVHKLQRAQHYIGHLNCSANPRNYDECTPCAIKTCHSTKYGYSTSPYL